MRSLLALLLAIGPLLARAGILSAVHGLLNYYTRHRVSDNFLFGIILAEGQLYATKLINQDLGKELDSLIDKCDDIIENNPRFWLNKAIVMRTGKALMRLKTTKHKKLTALERPIYRLEKNFLHGSPSRDNSSLCILEAMMGKQISDRCLRQEADIEARGYSLAHQVLYFSIASAIIPFPFITEKILSEKCGKILSEANYAWEKGLPNDLVDLFIEEVAVCSINNYKEFLTENILAFILSLQQENGCFSLRNEGPLIECDDHLSSTALVCLASFLYAAIESNQYEVL